MKTSFKRTWLYVIIGLLVAVLLLLCHGVRVGQFVDGASPAHAVDHVSVCCDGSIESAGGVLPSVHRLLSVIVLAVVFVITYRHLVRDHRVFSLYAQLIWRFGGANVFDPFRIFMQRGFLHPKVW